MRRLSQHFCTEAYQVYPIKNPGGVRVFVFLRFLFPFFSGGRSRGHAGRALGVVDTGMRKRRQNLGENRTLQR
eukprot:116412-Pyramimonas_sp.AAC.1